MRAWTDHTIHWLAFGWASRSATVARGRTSTSQSDSSYFTRRANRSPSSGLNKPNLCFVWALFIPAPWYSTLIHNHFSCIITCASEPEFEVSFFVCEHNNFGLPEVFLKQHPVSLPHLPLALFCHVVWHTRGLECLPCLVPRLQISSGGARRHHRRTYAWNARNRR